MRGRSAEDRVRAVAEAWFITEPVLFAVWTTHRLVVTTESPSLRTGRGRVEIHPAFASLLPESQLRQVLRVEAIRVLLGHPYTRRRPWMGHAWRASNITLGEHASSALPLPKAFDVFGHHDLDGGHFELYYDELANGTAATLAPAESDAEGGEAGRADAETPRGDGGAPSDDDPASALDRHFTGDAATRTALWDDDDLVRESLRDIVRSAESSRRWGTLAGTLRGAILATLTPRLDYRSMLRDFRRSILSSRRYLTRMWPNRRYDFDAMGSRRDFCTRLLVAIDVSGSISQEDAGRALAAINQLFRYGIETIDVVTFDTAVHSPKMRLAKARKALWAPAGGGTHFQPILDHLDVVTDYDGLIVITDGCAPKPTRPKNRRTRIAWLMNSRDVYEQNAPLLGETGRCAYMREGSAS